RAGGGAARRADQPPLPAEEGGDRPPVHDPRGTGDRRGRRGGCAPLPPHRRGRRAGDPRDAGQALIGPMPTPEPARPRRTAPLVASPPLTPLTQGQSAMRVLQVCAEIFPLLKTGGLADVAGALPQALQALGAETRVLLPGFAPILAGLDAPRELARLHPPAAMAQASVRLLHGRLTAVGVDAYVIDAP